MTPGKLDLPIIWRGCDYAPIIFKWKDPNGNPFPLWGWVPYARSINVDLLPVVTDYNNGIAQISLTRTQTFGLALGVEQWDWLWYREGDNITYPPILSGRVEIKEPVSEIEP